MALVYYISLMRNNLIRLNNKMNEFLIFISCFCALGLFIYILYKESKDNTEYDISKEKKPFWVECSKCFRIIRINEDTQYRYNLTNIKNIKCRKCK